MAGEAALQAAWMGSIPIVSTVHRLLSGLLVQWEDAGVAIRQSGFNSPAVHSLHFRSIPSVGLSVPGRLPFLSSLQIHNIHGTDAVRLLRTNPATRRERLAD
jgi:hypothetical protein